MGQASTTPIVEVNYDELTYELLLQEHKEDELASHWNPNRPTSLIGRLLMDSLGIFLIYTGTFVACDLLNTYRTGNWTSIMFAFLGPWNYITGAPLLHKFTHVFDHITSSGRAVNLCNTKYDDATKLCTVENPHPIMWGETDEEKACKSAADQAHKDCIMATPEYKDCTDHANDNACQYENGYMVCRYLNPQQIQDQCLSSFY